MVADDCRLVLKALVVVLYPFVIISGGITKMIKGHKTEARVTRADFSANVDGLDKAQDMQQYAKENAQKGSMWAGKVQK